MSTAMTAIALGSLAVLVVAPAAIAALRHVSIPDAPPRPEGWIPDEKDADGNVVVEGDLYETRAAMTARRADRPTSYEEPENPHCRCHYRARVVAVYPDGHRETIHQLSTIAPCRLPEPAAAR